MSNLWSLLNLAWELGYTIAIPVVLLGLGGAWMDKKMVTSPLFLLIGIILSVTVSSIAVYRKIRKLTP